MSWLSEFIKDSTDWIEEQTEATLKWVTTLTKGHIRELVKAIRIKWQEKANEYINAAEDAVADEGVDFLYEYFPEMADVPRAKVEEAVRKLYWKPLNYIKKKWDADWLEDI